jgi:hypothetical protein
MRIVLLTEDGLVVFDQPILANVIVSGSVPQHGATTAIHD